MTDFVEFVNLCFTPPLFVPSCLMLLIGVYWLFMMLGMLHLDMFHIDLDMDADIDVDADVDMEIGGHSSAMDWGVLALKWVNFGDVPLILWLTPFAVSFWGISYLLDRNLAADAGWLLLIGLFVRNVAISLFATKLITQPLKGKFDTKEPNTVDDLLGRDVIIKSQEVTERFGQAELRTDAAPLYLNVQSLGGTLKKGEMARIVDYDKTKGIYIIQGKTEET